MGLVTYLHGGETATAARMNSLFEELDNRIAQAMRNLSLVYLSHDGRFIKFAGTLFYFHTGTPTYSLLYSDPNGHQGRYTYNHSVYETAVAGMTVLESDSTKKIARCSPGGTPPLLWKSLQAHTVDVLGEPYAILEDSGIDLATIQADLLASAFDINTNYTPEKVYSDAVAEIVIEGLTTLEFPAAYNKYRFFRFNNLSESACVITFKKADTSTAHTVTIAAGESQCVRRTNPETGYVDGYRYFQKFIAGDRRFYARANLLGYKRPFESGSANNVVNPSILFDYVSDFLSGSPRFFIDKTIVCDMAAEYRTLFEAVVSDGAGGYEVSDSAIVADAMLHKGMLNCADEDSGDLMPTASEITFSGISTIVSTLAGIGITAELADNAVVMTVPPTDPDECRDLIPKTTNLFAKHQWLGSFNAMAGQAVDGYPDGSVVHTLNQPSHDLWLYSREEFDNTADGLTFTDHLLKRVDPGGEDLLAQRPVVLTGDTISDLKSLSYFGSEGTGGPGTGYSPANIPANQDTAIQEFINREARITPRGLTVTFKERLLCGDCTLAFFENDTLAAGAGFNLDALGYHAESGVLTKTHAFTVNDGDFPAAHTGSSIFLSPRYGRFFADHSAVTLSMLGVSDVALTNGDFHSWSYGLTEYDFTLGAVESSGIKIARLVPATIPQVRLIDVPGVGDITVFAPDQAVIYPSKGGLYKFFNEGSVSVGALTPSLDDFDARLDVPVNDDKMTRPVLSAETFNLMAESVNRITGFYPISITDRIFKYPAALDVALFNLSVEGIPVSKLDAADNEWMFLQFKPSGLGLRDSRYAPVDYFHEPTAPEIFVLGTVKTSLDLPASYWDAINQGVEIWTLNQNFIATIIDRSTNTVGGLRINYYDLEIEPDGAYTEGGRPGYVPDTALVMNQWEASGFGGPPISSHTDEEDKSVGFDRFENLKWTTWTDVAALDPRFGVFNSRMLQIGTIEYFDSTLAGSVTFTGLIGSGFNEAPEETPPTYYDIGYEIHCSATLNLFTRHMQPPPPAGPNFYDNFMSFDGEGVPCARKNFFAFVPGTGGDWVYYPESNIVVTATPYSMCADFELGLQIAPSVPENRIELFTESNPTAEGITWLVTDGVGTGGFELSFDADFMTANGVHATMEQNIHELTAHGYGDSTPSRIVIPLTGWHEHVGGGCAPGAVRVGSGSRHYIVLASNAVV